MIKILTLTYCIVSNSGQGVYFFQAIPPKLTGLKTATVNKYVDNFLPKPLFKPAESVAIPMSCVENALI